jgi:hypothetical protein
MIGVLNVMCVENVLPARIEFGTHVWSMYQKHAVRFRYSTQPRGYDDT